MYGGGGPEIVAAEVETIPACYHLASSHLALRQHFYGGQTQLFYDDAKFDL